MPVSNLFSSHRARDIGKSVNAKNRIQEFGHWGSGSGRPKNATSSKPLQTSFPVILCHKTKKKPCSRRIKKSRFSSFKIALAPRLLLGSLFNPARSIRGKKCDFFSDFGCDRALEVVVITRNPKMKDCHFYMFSY